MNETIMEGRERRNCVVKSFINRSITNVLNGIKDDTKMFQDNEREMRTVCFVKEQWILNLTLLFKAMRSKIRS